MNPGTLLDACRVPPCVAPRRMGLWEIRRLDLAAGSAMRAYADFVAPIAPYDSLTMLLRDTLATLHRSLGECVMEDSPRELRRHLPILLAASGRVLVSGLGLGCVVRGLLSKPTVTHVDVVEIDPAILSLVGAEFAGNPRVTLHLGDAETIEWPARTAWDFAWHDVWSEHESLDLVHMRLIARYASMIGQQGAWQMDRSVKRLLPSDILGISGRRRRAGVYWSARR